MKYRCGSCGAGKAASEPTPLTACACGSSRWRLSTVNAVFVDCGVDNCTDGAVAFAVEGDAYTQIEGFTVTNSHTAFELRGGGIVDAARVEHVVSERDVRGNRAHRRARRRNERKDRD